MIERVDKATNVLELTDSLGKQIARLTKSFEGAAGLVRVEVDGAVKFTTPEHRPEVADTFVKTLERGVGYEAGILLRHGGKHGCVKESVEHVHCVVHLRSDA